MKKIIYVLVLSSLIASCGGSEDELQPTTQSLEEIIINQIWQLKTLDYRFILDSNGYVYEKYEMCDSFSYKGVWTLQQSLLTITYQEGPLEISEISEITSFSEDEIMFNVYTDSTTNIDEVYVAVNTVIRGCMDSTSVNYNPNAVCSNKCYYTQTFIPDDGFEQNLIDLGHDDVLDDSVLTDNIINITQLNFDGFPRIYDLTGVEDFKDLEYLYVDGHELTSLDVSNNTKLIILHCHNNQLTSLDVTNNVDLTELYAWGNQLTNLNLLANTALIKLIVADNQLTSLNTSSLISLEYFAISKNQLYGLDVSNNTNLLNFDCYNNQLTSLDISNNIFLNSLAVGDDWDDDWGGGNNLTNLDISNNTLLTQIRCSHNPNLFCIKVHDILWADSLSSHLDSHQYFNENCP